MASGIRQMSPDAGKEAMHRGKTPGLDILLFLSLLSSISDITAALLLHLTAPC